MNHQLQIGLSNILGGMVAIAALAAPVAALSSQSSGTIAHKGQIHDPWRPMTEAEVEQAWQFVLQSRLGIAALNQLAIEGFISPNCPKSWYVNEKSGGFQSMLRVECPDARGASIALSYKDIRVIFNRFEDNIENFTVERILQE